MSNGTITLRTSTYTLTQNAILSLDSFTNKNLYNSRSYYAKWKSDSTISHM